MTEPTAIERVVIFAKEFDRRAERITELEDLLVDVLTKAQRPGSVLTRALNDPQRWYWLWGAEGGGIGHELVDERLLRYLAETGDA